VRLSAAGLGTKLNLALLIFLLVLAASLAGLIVYSFDRAHTNASNAHRKSLEDFGIQVVYAFVRLVAGTNSLALARASDDGVLAARYMTDSRQSATEAPIPLVGGDGGWSSDQTPGRQADAWIPAGLPSDSRAASHLEAASSLDSLLPALLATVDDGLGAYYAAYFVGLDGEARYYPPSGQFTGTDLRDRPGFYMVGPSANPQRSVIWTPPYVESTRGSVVSVLAPVYDGESFIGAIGFDIPMARFVQEIDNTHPTHDGYAFYIDRLGELVASTHSAKVTTALANPGNEALGDAVEAMRAGEQGFVRARLADADVFITYAPMEGLGGSMAFVAPVEAFLSEIETWTPSDLITREGTRTVRLTLSAMVGLFTVALASATYLNRRVVLRPIEALVSGTRAIARGDLSTTIAVRGEDELATLAKSFNEMTAEIRERRDSLERQVRERTRELAMLLETSRSVASTLELRPLDGTDRSRSRLLAHGTLPRRG
jgi:HAMP domain-containing protein